MKKRTESVIDFIVTLFMVTVVFAVIWNYMYDFVLYDSYEDR